MLLGPWRETEWGGVATKILAARHSFQKQYLICKTVELVSGRYSGLYYDFECMNAHLYPYGRESHHRRDYPTIQEAMDGIDKHLLLLGHKLLTEEQAERLSLLI